MKIALRKLMKFPISIILTSPILATLSYEWGKPKRPFEAAKMENVEIINQGRNGYTLKLSYPGYEFQKINLFSKELYLSFDQNRKDFEERAILAEGNFDREKWDGSVREGAVFRHTYQGLTIRPANNFFLNDKKSVGSFSLYFLVKPFEQRGKTPILQKIGYYSGEKYGLEITLNKGELSVAFHNLWLNTEGKRLSLFLNSRENLSMYEFQPVLIVYDESKSQVSLFINGKEQDVVYTKESFEPEGSPLILRNHPVDNSVILIGYGFLGVIDEFLMTKEILPANFSLNRFPGFVFENIEPPKPGRFFSKVYDLGYSESEIVDWKMKKKVPQGTALKFYLRISNRPFLPDTPEDLLPFLSVRGEPKLFGRYFQYRVDFYTDSAGKETPLLEELTILAKENPPPEAPQGLEVEEVGPDFVTLSFLRNQEKDVLEGGRYHIYYGLKPYEALGVIRYAQVELSPFGMATKTINDQEHRYVTEDVRKKNRLIFRIDNEVITQNLLYARTNPILSYSYPLLLKNRPYYFWVTACDNAYKESVEFMDHESPPSKAILVRLELP